MDVLSLDVVAVQFHCSGGKAFHSGQHVRKGRLAVSFHAGDSDDLALMDVKGNIIQDTLSGNAVLHQVPDTKHRLSHSGIFLLDL